VEQTVPSPPSVGGDPNAWLFDRVNVNIWGIQISTDGGTTWGSPSFEQISTNIVAEGVHLVEADTVGLTPGPIDTLTFLSDFDTAIGSTVRIKVSPTSDLGVRFRFGGGGVVSRYRTSFRTPATILMTSDPSERIISMNLGTPAFTDLDPGFGTSGAFFNQRLQAQVGWNFGRAVPTSLTVPGGEQVLTLPYTYDYQRYLYFDAQSALIVIHTGGGSFYEAGVPVTGEWRLTLHIEDPDYLGSVNNMPQTIAPAGKLTGLFDAEKRVLDSVPVTLTAGESITYSPPDLGNGWYYEGVSAVHIVSQCDPPSESNPGCNANLITTDGFHVGSDSGVEGVDQEWWALNTGITITNPTSTAISVKITYTVFYVADAVNKISISDTESVFDGTHMLHTVSMTLGSSMPDSGLGFSSPYADINIQLPSLDWRAASDVRTPHGSADAVDGHFAFVNDYLAAPYGAGYVGTWSAYQRNVVFFYPWVTYGSAAVGTWTYQVLEPSVTPVCNPPACNTPAGANVQVDLGSGTQATFGQVTTEGVTTVNASGTNPEPPQPNYQFLNTFYDIATTAVFSGPVTLCLTYDDSGIPSDREQTLQLFHWNGTAWVDITTSLDTANNTICGQSTSLSPFAIGYQLYVFSGFLQPINTDGSSIFKLGSTVPVKFQLKDVQGSFVTNAVAKIYVAKISNNVIGSEIEAVSTAAATSGNTFRYESSTNQYIFNLSTKNLSAGTWQIRILLGDGTSQYVVISLR
jgi:hypothetical protein